MGLGKMGLGELGLGEMGLGEMGQNPTVGYTSVASVSTVDSGITNLIHDGCKLWMCPLKREQARCECKSELQDVNSL